MTVLGAVQMNDEFLHRLRKEPPPDFVARLSARLERQGRQRARFSIVRSLVLGLLLGGSAIAATLWAVHGARTESRTAAAQPLDSDSRSLRQPPPASRAQQRSSVARTPFGEVKSAEEDRAAPALTPASISSPSLAEPHAPDASRGGVIGGFARQARSAGEARTGTRRAIIRVAGPEVGLLLAKRIGERVGLADLETDRVDDDEAIRRLCASSGARAADLIVTMRTLTKDELGRCMTVQSSAIEQTRLGYVGVAISAAKTATVVRLSPREIFLALAKRIPDPADPSRFIANPNVSWHQVHAGYREGPITFFGPKQDSLLAKVFAAVILRAGCDTFPSIKALSQTDPERHRRICHEIREDSVYTPVYEGEFFLTQTLWGDPNALAVLSLPFFDAHRAELSDSLLAGPMPTKESIRSEAYEGAAAVYISMRQDRLNRVLALQWYARESVSERALGPHGYLMVDGLVPLDEAEDVARSNVFEETNDRARSVLRR